MTPHPTTIEARTDPALLADGLVRDASGIWCARGAGRVSYPEEGHERVFGVEESSFWFAHRNRCIVAAMRRHPPAGPVLDVGAGNGFVSLGLRRAGIPTILLEAGPGGAANARARGLDPVVCATLEGARFRTGAVAAAGLFDVLEHIADDGAALLELRRVLAPGGRLYLTVPAYAWLWSDDDVFTGHHRRYTRERLAARLRAHGFALERATYLFWPLPAPILLWRTLPSLLDRAEAGTIAHHHADEGLPEGLLGRLLGGALSVEARHVEAGGAVPFGGSLLAVARSTLVPVPRRRYGSGGGTP